MFIKIKELFMIWKIDRAVIKDVFVKLGLFFIMGGIAAYVFEDKIDALATIYAIISGMVFIFIGATRLHKKEG